MEEILEIYIFKKKKSFRLQENLHPLVRQFTHQYDKIIIPEQMCYVSTLEMETWTVPFQVSNFIKIEK